MVDKKSEWEGSKILDLTKRRKALEVIRHDVSRVQMELFGPTVIPPNQELIFSPVFLFQTCLPLREVRHHQLIDGAYKRKNQSIELEMLSNLGPEMLPFGKHPRLFLMWLTNAIAQTPEALTDDGYLKLTGSYRQFCASVGVDPSCGVNGSGRSLINQITRLMGCTFRIRTPYAEKGETRMRMRVISISTDLDLSWDEAKGRPRDWMEGIDHAFRLSKDFCDEIRKRRMPIDSRHMAILCSGETGSLRIDVYHVINHMNWSLHNQGKDEFSWYWRNLHEQFGSFGTSREFTRQFMKAIDWIRAHLWSDLQCRGSDDGRFVLMRSPHPTSVEHGRFRRDRLGS